MIVTFAHLPGSSSDVRGGAKKERKRKKERQRERARRFRERERMSRFSLFASRQSGKTCCYNKRATCNESKIREKRAAQKNESVSWGELCRCCSPFFASLLNLARNKIAWKRSPSRSTVECRISHFDSELDRRLLLSTASKGME